MDIVEIRWRLWRRRAFDLEELVPQLARVSSFVNRDRKNWRAFDNALTDKHAHTPHIELAQKLLECGPKRHCGHPLCFSCLFTFQQRFSAETLRLAQGYSDEELSQLTVVVSVVHSSLEAPPVTEAFRQAIGQFTAAWKGAVEEWGGAVWARGRFEIEGLPPGGRLGANKTRTAMCLGYDPSCCEAAWNLHLHAVVGHRRVKRLDLRYDLVRVFNAPYQLELRPLHDDKSLSTNITNIVGYITKPELLRDWLPSKKSATHRPRVPHYLRMYAEMLADLGGLKGRTLFRYDYVDNKR
ncbi:hypothetical protein [Azospirillum aestuarii]|uniref:hypothetical protein n=1 Tax=Azospirillum aestuarii TaxID=2802052 RepID=UPI004054FA5F